MKPTSFTMKTALLATLIISGKAALAQNLPDEINHPQYLRIYQNLEQVLAAKTDEYNKLAAQQSELQKNIAQMEVDNREIPAENIRLDQLINTKRQELSRIASEMQGLEGVMDRIIEDLRRIDNVIAQLQRDLNEETQRANQINARRVQLTQQLSAVTARLQQEQREEQQSINVLNRLNRELDRDIKNRNDDIAEKRQLTLDVERYKRELPALKTKLTTNTQQITTKKASLNEAQSKLPSVKAELGQQQTKLAQADAEISPKKSKLAELEAELGRQMPEVAKLQKEIQELTAKIESNKNKINAAGLEALKAKRDALEKELASANAQIDALNKQIIAAKEAIKPDLAELQEVRKQIRELERSGANPTELARLKLQADAIEKRLAPKRQEIARLEKQYENLLIANAHRNQELTNLKDQVTKVEAMVAALIQENESAKDKIAANLRVIDERTAANSGLVKEINELKAVIKALEVNREKIAKEVNQLKTQETNLTTRISELTKEIAALETESSTLAKTVADMEKAITDFPLAIRRLDLHMAKLEEQIQAARQQINREEKLLARIQQDRMAIEREVALVQTDLSRVNQDLASANQLIGAIQNKLVKENGEREALTRYNQDSIRKYDGLKAQKTAAETVIADSIKAIEVNNQDLAYISRELPKLRNELNGLNPRVTAAAGARDEAQDKVDSANVNYQNRLSLYNRYLSDAQTLGTERANLGTADGVKAGSVEARTKANKLAAENAAAEAKWVAMRRGYVRGEIGGFEAGFEIGMSSSADAALGDRDGKVAGEKRAKDHANMVLKPEFYLEELERRLREDEVALKKNIAFKMVDEVSIVASAVSRNNVPELTAEEIDASMRILSSLDSLIEQAQVEASEVVALRERLSNGRNVYTTPGAGENANNANCSGVYKNVKEFIEACKASYGARYQGLYIAAHQDSFIKEYGQTFANQIVNTFNAELNRLYPGFLKEATNVGKDVGVAAGKKEIYQQSFSRAENASYAANIAKEEARVEMEAVALVEEHLKNNAALTIKGEAKLKSNDAYGIAPGAEVELKLLVKNVGEKASQGNSLVKIKEASNLILTNREAAVASVAPRSVADLSVMNFKVSDAASPGSRVVLAGEIVHPGNHYRGSRTENFRLEATIAVNPSVDTEATFDTTPRVANLGFTKKHEIDFSIRQKFEGVEQGYEISIEEINSNYVRFSNKVITTERLSRNTGKKVTFEYKLEKSARGKTINLKVTVKNKGTVVKTQDLQIKAE